MTSAQHPTAFVTQADGFIGTELVKVLVAEGHQVFGLARSVEAAQHVRRMGAVSLVGDPLVPGRWQDEAATADWVFHLATLPTSGLPVPRRGDDTLARARVTIDTHLLDAVAAGTTRRIVYAADTTCYGPTGAQPITEDEPIRPSRWGRCLAPALDRIDGYVIAGLPIITALPGCVYGNGSWFRHHVIDPVMHGRRVLTFGARGPLVSPIHVHDCARALLHLARHGDEGGRYFVVDGSPVRINEFAERFARLAGRPLRRWRLPHAAAPFLLSPGLAGPVAADAVFSNIRLRGIGYRWQFPTLDEGLEDVLRRLS